jgi:hypothetical protein
MTGIEYIVAWREFALGAAARWPCDTPETLMDLWAAPFRNGAKKYLLAELDVQNKSQVWGNRAVATPQFCDFEHHTGRIQANATSDPG